MPKAAPALGSSSFITDATGYATQHLQYLPFGETFVDQQNGYDSRYTFSAKEKDDETQYSYFGARYYDSDLSVWLSVDPLSDSFPAWSSYNYCFQNPMRFLDPNGEGPGDLFESIDAAAIDFGNTYNDNSIKSNREFMSTIYKVKDENGNTKYSYTIPNVGKVDGGGIKPSLGETKRRDRVAFIHTHSAYNAEFDSENGGENFSYEDEMFARCRNRPLYLATPGGKLKEFRFLRDRPGESRLVSNEMPSDPGSPPQNRVNNIDFAPLPKDEPAIFLKK